MSLLKLRRILVFLRLIDDHDGNLSLTNLAVLITLGKLLLASNVIAPTDLGAIIAALASYQAKKMFAPKSGES